MRTEYLQDPKMSYRKLAEKYNFSLKKITTRAGSENWVSLRKQLSNKIIKKTINRISTEKSNDLAKCIRSTNKLLNHIDRALDKVENFEEYAVIKDDKKGVVKVSLDRTDTKAINNMARALGNIFNILKAAETDAADTKDNAPAIVIKGGDDGYAE